MMGRMKCTAWSWRNGYCKGFRTRHELTNSDNRQVRAGEELDTEALVSYLRAHHEGLGVREGDDLWEFAKFAGGHSNLTYFIEFGSKHFVLRRPPLGPVAPTAHDMPREFRLLKAIHPHFTLAPRPIWLCEDASIIG